MAANEPCPECKSAKKLHSVKDDSDGQCTGIGCPSPRPPPRINFSGASPVGSGHGGGERRALWHPVGC